MRLLDPIQMSGGVTVVSGPSALDEITRRALSEPASPVTRPSSADPQLSFRLAILEQIFLHPRPRASEQSGNPITRFILRSIEGPLPRIRSFTSPAEVRVVLQSLESRIRVGASFEQALNQERIHLSDALFSSAFIRGILNPNISREELIRLGFEEAELQSLNTSALNRNPALALAFQSLFHQTTRDPNHLENSGRVLNSIQANGRISEARRNLEDPKHLLLLATGVAASEVAGGLAARLIADHFLVRALAGAIAFPMSQEILQDLAQGRRTHFTLQNFRQEFVTTLPFSFASPLGRGFVAPYVNRVGVGTFRASFAELSASTATIAAVNNLVIHPGEAGSLAQELAEAGLVESQMRVAGGMLQGGRQAGSAALRAGLSAYLESEAAARNSNSSSPSLGRFASPIFWMMMGAEENGGGILTPEQLRARYANNPAALAKLEAMLARQAENASSHTPSYGISSVVEIPGGRFVRGSTSPESFSNERPVRVVEVSGFWMKQTPVTWGECGDYVAFHGSEQSHGLIGRNSKTGNWEVIARGREKSLHTDNSLMLSGRNEEDAYQYCSVQRLVPERFSIPGGKEDHPVIEMTWYEALGFSDWWGREHFGRPGRLPTEAEWEYAARGPMERQGNVSEEVIPWEGRENFVALSGEGTLELGARIFEGRDRNQLEALLRNGIPIGFWRVHSTARGIYEEPAIWSSANTLRKSTRSVLEGVEGPYGLVDMNGNVCEWIQDARRGEGGDYSGQEYENVNPRGPVATHRVLRGGSWYDNGASRDLRAASRNNNFPVVCYYTIGFRPVLSED